MRKAGDSGQKGSTQIWKSEKRHLAKYGLLLGYDDRCKPSTPACGAGWGQARGARRTAHGAGCRAGVRAQGWGWREHAQLDGEETHGTRKVKRQRSIVPKTAKEGAVR